MIQTFNLRLVTLSLVLVLLGVAAYGFAAANTVPDSGAGDGSGNITGYTVSNISYTLDSNDPTKINAVTFNLSAAPSVLKPNVVKIKLVSSSNTWYTCTTNSTNSPYAYSCNTTAPQATVQAADQLRVVAAQ